MRWLRDLEGYVARGEPVCLVTVVATQGSTPREAGAKMLVDGGGRIHGSVGGGRLEEIAREEARVALREGRPRSRRVPLGASAGQCCGGVVDLFFEPLQAGPPLLLFGAGHVGQALCQVLEGTPFRVHVVDERAEWITAPGLPGSVRRHDRPWEEALPELPWSEDDAPFVCVMTHRHDVDEQIVAATLERPARYVGMIGSRTKAAKIRARLEARGVPAAALDRVRCPMGVTGGGKTPREVAISIAAELLQVLHQATPADP